VELYLKFDCQLLENLRIADIIESDYSGKTESYTIEMEIHGGSILMKQVHRIGDVSKRHKVCMILVGVAIILSCTLIPSAVVYSSSKNLKDGIAFEARGLKMKVENGYLGMMRLGRDTSIYTKIEADESDFQGTVMVHVPDAAGDVVVYSKEVDLKKGEKTTVEFILKVINPWDRFVLQVQNKYNEIIAAKVIKTIVDTTMDRPYIGVLSEENGRLEYLKNEKSNVVNLNLGYMHECMADWNLFDEIVIDQFDTNQMSKEQFRLLTEWVKQGGTLVLGTGQYYEKMIPRFVREGIFEVKGEGEFPYFTLLGLSCEQLNALQTEKSGSYSIRAEYANQRIKTAVSKFRVKNSHVLRKETEPLLESYRYGEGKILLYHIELGSAKIQNHILSFDISNTIQKELSAQRQELLVYEQYGGNVESESMNVVQEGNDIKLHSIAGYIILIVIYIIIVGPVLYFLLAKWEKTQYFWWVVPLCMVVFFLAVLADGSSSRITKLRAGYFSVLYYDDQQVREEAVYNLTVPSMGTFTLEYDPDTRVEATNDRDYVYYMDCKEPGWNITDCYNRVIRETEHGSEVSMVELKPFTTRYFRAEKTYSVGGEYQYDLRSTEDGIEGSFTNQLGFDLGPTYLLGGSSIVSLGTVDLGQTIQIDRGEGVPLLTSEYSMVVDYVEGYEDIQKEFGDYSVEVVNAINLMVKKYFAGGRADSFIISFVESNYGNGIIGKLKHQADAKGIELLVLPVTIDGSQDGGCFVPELGSDYQIISGGQEHADIYRYFSGTIELKYQFPEADRITELCYTKYLNREFNNDTNVGFSGEIFLYNYRSKRYDQIFQEDTRCMRELGAYLNEDNQMIIKYCVKSELGGSYMNMPYISYYKEVR